MAQVGADWWVQHFDAVNRAIEQSADVDQLLENVRDAVRTAIEGVVIEVGSAATNPAALTLELRPKLGPTYVLTIDSVRALTGSERGFVDEVARRVTDALSVLALARALRETKRCLEDAQRIAQFGYWENDLERDRITWSPEIFRLLGLPPTENVTAATFRALIHPDDLHLQLEASARARAGDGRYDLEYRLVRPDGEVRTVHSVGDLDRHANGRPCRGFGIVQDVTERRRAEDALRASEARFRTFADHATDGFFLHDDDGVVIDVNGEACRSLGYSREELIGMSPDLFDPDFDASMRTRVRARLARGEVVAFESTHRRKDGTVFPVEVRIRPFLHGDRKLGLSLARDVSERKHAERALRETQDQFRQAQKMEAVGRLAGGIAHDFNNLLMIILAAAEAAQTHLRADDPVRELVDDLAEAGKRAGELTQQLLAFSRKQVLQQRIVDVNERVMASRKLLDHVLGADIEVEVIAGATSGLINVDAGQFDQAIVNLVVNARDAMPDGGRIVIETRTVVRPDDHETYVRVSVIDSGHGMDAATRSRIFEPFFTTKEVGRGTGLGLAMVYSFVAQFGGQIEVQSEPGRGASFHMYLRAVPEMTTALEAVHEHAAAPTGTETVLLVEDDDAVRRMCRRMLEASGYTVVEARDGIDAFDVARRSGALHLLLTDCVMPRLGGQALAVRMVEERPGIGVLLMTGYATEETLDAGMACLQKPFSADVMARKVREVLDARVQRDASQSP